MTYTTLGECLTVFPTKDHSTRVVFTLRWDDWTPVISVTGYRNNVEVSTEETMEILPVQEWPDFRLIENTRKG